MAAIPHPVVGEAATAAEILAFQEECRSNLASLLCQAIADHDKLAAAAVMLRRDCDIDLVSITTVPPHVLISWFNEALNYCRYCRNPFGCAVALIGHNCVHQRNCEVCEAFVQYIESDGGFYSIHLRGNVFTACEDDDGWYVEYNPHRFVTIDIAALQASFDDYPMAVPYALETVCGYIPGLRNVFADRLKDLDEDDILRTLFAARIEFFGTLPKSAK